MAGIATLSLSKPPPTERCRWAGTIAITSPATPAATSLRPAHSYARSAVNTVATIPPQTGTKQHTSSSVQARPQALRLAWMAAAVMCIAG